MKPKLSLKTLYRSPVRTVLTFILLAAVTFALFAQVIEYSVAEREMKKAVEQYDGVLTVESSPLNKDAAESHTPAYMFSDERVSVSHLSPYLQEYFRSLAYEHLTAEQIDTLSALPYITHTDTRYMTAGYSDTYTRVDDGREYYNYTQQCVIEATVEFLHAGRITVGDIEVIGGVPMNNFNYFPSVFVVMEDTNSMSMIVQEGYPLDEYLVYMRYGITERITTMITGDAKYGWNLIDTLEVGKRYLFVVRYDNYTISYDSTPQYILTDPFVNQYCEAVIPLEGEPENYLETEKFSDIRRYIDNINTRLHTFDVVYTESTGSIRYFADKTIDVSEGRGLTKEDTANKANVCVIHFDMAVEHGLSVGDTITIKLGDKLFEQYISNGAIAVSPYQESENLTEVTLEIVGLFKDSRSDDLVTSDPSWSYSANTIFVPKHLLNVPEEELKNHTFSPSEVSFVVEDAWNIIAFTEESLPLISSMGLTAVVSDGGWADIMSGYRESERLSVIKILVLTGAVFISTCFVAFLYVVGKKRDYAIMRVLGTSKKKSGKALLLPLLVITVIAVTVGSCAAVIYTQHTISASDSIKYLSGIMTVDVSIPAGIVLSCALGEIALTLLLALCLIGIMGKSSPLALIQAQVQKQKKKSLKKSKATAAPEISEPVILGEWVSIEPAKHDGKSRSVSFVLRFVKRHIKRTAGKAVMLILVTLLLLSVVGQLAVMDAAYHTLYSETPVISNYAGSLNLNYVSQLIESGYVKDVYFEETSGISVNERMFAAYITSDVERLTGGRAEVIWDEGRSAADLQQVNSVVVVEESVMDILGIELGDTVLFAKPYDVGKIKNSYLSEYIETHGKPNLDPNSEEYAQWENEVLSLYSDEIDAELAEISHEFTVIGYAVTDEKEYIGCVFTSGCLEIATGYGKLVILDIIEATLIDNWKIDEYREFGEALAAANLTGEIAFLMDTSKLDNVLNNIKLMDTLFPIIVAAVLVIGAFLCGLLIVQTSKDIAIMRILGTSKRRVRIIMITEHTFLCLIGVLLSLIIMLIRKAGVDVFLQMLNVCAMYLCAVLASSVIASAMASRKNVLELLQTKE
ncbi:MAG: hypothetical protein IJ017_02710 [Oscillospiraceae bacterium]|nr:hypothetical protein [Oscillospiraceae bacterium]